MFQDRLSDSTLIPIENDVSKPLEYSDICDEFERSKAKKSNYSITQLQ